MGDCMRACMRKGVNRGMESDGAGLISPEPKGKYLKPPPPCGGGTSLHCICAAGAAHPRTLHGAWHPTAPVQQGRCTLQRCRRAAPHCLCAVLTESFYSGQLKDLNGWSCGSVPSSLNASWRPPGSRRWAGAVAI